MWLPFAVAFAALLVSGVLTSGHAQVVGLTLGAPFREGSAVSATSAPAYAPYLAPAPQHRAPANVDAILDQLRARGFSHFSGVQRKGGSIICEATGPRRERVRLVVDAATGDISGVAVIGFGDKRY
ncbi:hypothetical protein V5F77_14230 [Xanthobacter sp. DSM 24535]|uniref:hypothetical protein n=1 Tax=Roseixanthobacter psychrophilus TaxID=3119917 RepID=UPI00372874F6